MAENTETPATAPLIAGVELGGTKIVCLLASGPDDIRDEVRLPTTTPEEALGEVRAVLERWKAEHDFKALGIGSFGPLELDDRAANWGSIVFTPKPGWSDADLTMLGKDLGVPMAIDTDVNGAAFAEGVWGAAQGLKSFSYITVGTGIGVGVVINGQSVSGLGHTEAGHLRVGRIAGDTWPGSCPYHSDCVEGLAAGPALLARTGKPGETLSADDPAWEMVVHALGGLLHNLVLTIAPERILIGGGVFGNNDHLFARLRSALIESLAGYATAGRIAAMIDDYVVPPGLGGMAGPLGAIVLGRNALKS
ncbi:ROK family protein [Brevundimonas goettingensis]|uniref:fructokinase n=1 Tax=Brevundimonas goettingensis TaxID=2774190 RepID=A0A975GUH5_9CAUL|nr:ROK family protein [Brevundimonas goettingensis]QTC90072.1 ROK family protein [Brevundimonas goettingensis]